MSEVIKGMFGGAIGAGLVIKAFGFKRKASVVEKLMRNPDNFEARAFVQNNEVVIKIKERES